MELEDLQKAVNAFIHKDTDKKSIMFLACDKDKCMTMGFGRRQDLVKLFYQMFLSDEKEEFIDCINEAVSMYEGEIRKAEGLRMITINSQIKTKS